VISLPMGAGQVTNPPSAICMTNKLRIAAVLHASRRENLLATELA